MLSWNAHISMKKSFFHSIKCGKTTYAGFFFAFKKILQIIFSGYLFQYRKYLRILKFEHFVAHKPLISEEWNVKGQPKNPS